MSSENLFLGGPVSLGYSTVFQFFTTTEGQLAQVTLESDIWVEVRNPESASSEKSVFDGEVSDVLPFSDVALAPGGREHLAKECYQSLTERYDSGFPADIRDGNGKSFTVKLDEPLPVMDERGHVSAVTLENLGILLRGSPMNASSLSNSTYHPKLLDGPV